jgi:hypothetical protein
MKKIYPASWWSVAKPYARSITSTSCVPGVGMTPPMPPERIVPSRASTASPKPYLCPNRVGPARRRARPGARPRPRSPAPTSPRRSNPGGRFVGGGSSLGSSAPTSSAQRYPLLSPPPGRRVELGERRHRRHRRDRRPAAVRARRAPRPPRARARAQSRAPRELLTLSTRARCAASASAAHAHAHAVRGSAPVAQMVRASTCEVPPLSFATTLIGPLIFKPMVHHSKGGHTKTGLGRAVSPRARGPRPAPPASASSLEVAARSAVSYIEYA